MSQDALVRVIIPTSSEFLKQWHVWVQGKVAKHFKRDKERIPDFAQRARLRLLSKDFVSRWFYKHLTDDLVDAEQASVMLGGVPVVYLSRLPPAGGERGSHDAAWRISDILNYANFDYERYFYSIQEHTLDTQKLIRYLGLGTFDSGNFAPSSSAYGTLESLYRQGRMRPSELTEHECSEKVDSIPHLVGRCGVSGCDRKHYSRGYCSTHYSYSKKKVCPECDAGRKSLKDRGISLANRWSDPAVKKVIDRLRWNDSQLAPFLRDWNNSNKIFALPRYILRKPNEATVDAGLIKYANMIIDNDVVNAFKSIGRSEDKPKVDSDSSDMGHEPIQLKSGSDSSGESDDSYEDSSIHRAEERKDILDIMVGAKLTEDEIKIIMKMDMEGSTAKEVADDMSMPLMRINKLRAGAMAKMRNLAKAEYLAKYA